MSWDSILNKASWLSLKEREALRHNEIKDESQKLIRILCSLLFAEKVFRTRCKKFSLFLETLFPYFSSTIGIWNFHLMHAESFGYKKKEFRSLLLDEMRSTEIVIRFLRERIGLHKDPEHIFAEYNHAPNATVVAALQRALNNEGEELLEDGLLGPQTLSALQKKFADVSEAFSSNQIQPFVPQVVVKRDVKYALGRLKRAFLDPQEITKLPLIFHHHIDVPAYVTWGMSAFNSLSEEICASI